MSQSEKNKLNPSKATVSYEAIRIVCVNEEFTNDSSISESNWNLEKIRDLVPATDIFSSVALFMEYLDCLKYEQVLLIVSISVAKRILKDIKNADFVVAVLIFSTHETLSKHATLLNQCSKIIGIINDENKLLEAVESATSFAKRNLHEKSIIYIRGDQEPERWSKENVNFYCEKLMFELWLKVPDNHEGKEHFIEIWKNYTGKNNNKYIQKFEEDYTPDQALTWYTASTLLFSFLNKALFTSDIKFISLIQFFMKDVYEQLEEMHRTQRVSIRTVYRGLTLSLRTIEKLKKHRRKPIAIKGFYSTSMTRDIALEFALESFQAKTDPNVVMVIYEIMINPAASSLFANIEILSEFQYEREILFSPNSTFIVDDVVNPEETDSCKVYVVKLTTTNCMESLFQEYKNAYTEDFREHKPIVNIGRILLNQLNDKDRATKHFQETLWYGKSKFQMTKNDLADVHIQLGDISLKKKNHFEAKKSYEKALELYEETYIDIYQHEIFFRVDCHLKIGLVEMAEWNFQKASYYFEEARKILNGYHNPSIAKEVEIEHMKEKLRLEAYKFGKDHVKDPIEDFKNIVIKRFNELIEKVQRANIRNKHERLFSILGDLVETHRFLCDTRKVHRLLQQRREFVENFFALNRSKQLQTIRELVEFYAEENMMKKAKRFIAIKLGQNVTDESSVELAQISMAMGNFQKAFEIAVKMTPVDEQMIEEILSIVFYSNAKKVCIRLLKEWIHYLDAHYTSIDQRKGLAFLRLAIIYRQIGKIDKAPYYLKESFQIFYAHPNKLYLRTLEDIRGHWKEITHYEFHIASIVCADQDPYNESRCTNSSK